jgi:hypothetical protein
VWLLTWILTTFAGGYCGLDVAMVVVATFFVAMSCGFPVPVFADSIEGFFNETLYKVIFVYERITGSNQKSFGH